MVIVFSAHSHKGMVRANNEDNFFADGMMLLSEYRDREFSVDTAANAPVLLAVCDGMGGEESGEIASEIAVIKLAEMANTVKNTPWEKLNEVVRLYIDNVQSQLKVCGKRMGTTLALAVITEKGVRCFNVGDTRIYCLKSGKLTQVTYDHTFGAEMVRKNKINMNWARRCKNGNKLTRCIGIGDNCNAEEASVIRGKCRLLICSDGLTDMVSFSEIEKILTDTVCMSEAAEQLIRSALKYGGKDNITVIAADVPAKPPPEVVNIFKNLFS